MQNTSRSEILTQVSPRLPTVLMSQKNKRIRDLLALLSIYRHHALRRVSISVSCTEVAAHDILLLGSMTLARLDQIKVISMETNCVTAKIVIVWYLIAKVLGQKTVSHGNIEGYHVYHSSIDVSCKTMSSMRTRLTFSVMDRAAL